MHRGSIGNDDWSGVADPSERRKIQNRLNQRAKRQRQRMLNGLLEPHSGPSKNLWAGHGVLVPIQSSANSSVASSQALSQASRDTIYQAYHPSIATLKELQILPKSILAEDQASEPTREISIGPLVLEFPSHTRLPKVLFPLSPDHRLITLIQYNVKRALLTNMALLENLKHIPREYESALSLLPLTIPPPALIPSTLLPTEIQLNTPHSPLIDSVPFPEMRNNLILKADEYDMDELAGDGYGGLFGGFSDLEVRGVMVWGDPWKTDQWELTEAFAKKWKFLLTDCVDLLESTNRWREARGECRLILEV